eukprot:Selendium_serpulae@DN5536_c2_g1_i2.p1
MSEFYQLRGLASYGGKKKALLIGINYAGSEAELAGCINDVRLIGSRLKHSGFDDIRTMTDERSTSSSLQSTKANMVECMKWLVNGARRGDQLFFHFSGHGTQVRDRSGDESDGFDESLMPVDYKKAGPLIDDVLHEIFVKNLPNGVRLTALLDCCHSGSLMDLPFAYKAPLNKSRAMEVPQFA